MIKKKNKKKEETKTAYEMNQFLENPNLWDNLVIDELIKQL